MTNIEQAAQLLSEIGEDKFSPKSVKAVVEKSLELLKEEKVDVKVNIDKVIQMLDEISNDPNIDITVRTMIWNVVSVLEAQ